VTRRFHKINTKIWRAEELGSAELLCGSFADYAYDIHTHDKACFALLIRGAIRIKMRGSEFTARAGEIYAIDAEEPHEGWSIDDAGWSLRTLYVELTRLRTFLGDCGVSDKWVPILAGPIIRDPELALLFRDVHCRSENSAPPLGCEEAYLRFIARLFERHTLHAGVKIDATREAQAVRLARDFLDDHLEDRVGLGDIAAAAGLPPFRLFRAFERATGMSPHTYQRQARIRLATSLLRRGCSLCDVAATAGFADQAHFTRSFRRSLGITPGAYRDAFN